MEKEKEVKYAFEPRLEWDEGVRTYLSQAYGASKFDEICAALSRPSVHSCVRVNTLRTTRRDVMKKLAGLEAWKDEHLGWFGGRNGRVVTSQVELLSLAPGTVDGAESDAGQGDEWFCEDGGVGEAQMTRGTMAAIEEHAVLDNVVLVRGRGPCEVNYVAGSGGSLKEVVVSRKCAEAVLRGAHVFVPGVLACSGHIERGDVVAVSVAVERPDGSGGWSVGLTRGTTLSSDHANAQLDGCDRSGWFIGKGEAMLSRASIFKEMKGVAVRMTERVYQLPPFNGLLEGEIFLQNLPSVVAAHVLDPQPGERILDMCAAPGGKTTAIALLMLDKGECIALDRSHSKVREIRSLTQEMGLTCIHAYKLDALKSVQKEFPQQVGSPSIAVQTMSPLVEEAASLPDESCCLPGQRETSGPYTSRAEERKRARKMKSGPGRSQDVGVKVEKVTGFACRSFDRVLLDAPCSALGLRPRLFAGEETLDKLRKNGSYQRRMLDQAVQLVRPGGILLYSTCTINPGENEAVVRYALDKYGYLSLVPQTPILGGPGLVGGLDVFDGVSHREWLRDGEQHLVQRFDPSDHGDTIGFFIAKFQVAKDCDLET